MKNNSTKIIAFIGTVALSLSALFVSVGSASGGNPFGANPPGFFDPMPIGSIDQLVDVNEPTVQYDSACDPLHDVDIMITNNSVGLDQEFSVYIMPANPEGMAVPLYANNHVAVGSISSAVVSFDSNLAGNVDLHILVFLNPMNADSPLLDVFIDACPWVEIWPNPIDEDGPGEELEVIEDNEIIDDEEGPGIIIGEGNEGNDDEDGEDAPVVVEGNDDEDGEDAPVVVEGNDDEDGEDAPVVVEGNDKGDNQGVPVIVENNDKGDNQGVPVQAEGNCDCLDADDTSHPEWENIWGSDNTKDGVFNDEGDEVLGWENITVSEASEIGVPPEPEVNPDDTGQTEDGEEVAFGEVKDSQGSSGLSLLWIILIIVGGVATVGKTTRAIQKNNS
jgi:hypothetical protein